MVLAGTRCCANCTWSHRTEKDGCVFPSSPKSSPQKPKGKKKDKDDDDYDTS